MPLVAPLDVVGSSTLAAVGGKALNLGLLTAAGFPVPRGFVVSTQAYELAVGARVDAELAGLEVSSDPASLADRIRTAVLAAPVPDVVRTSVLAGHRALDPDVGLAVRSSATAEDLAFASFAGQQDTFLNVVGDEALVDAVRRCWASL